jgi:type II secretory pathway pseudopilin PulG
MRRGFSLVELLLALLLLQVGILATAGMVLISQQNFRRAELTLRGLLEAGWIADSLARAGGGESGTISFPWGEIRWSPESAPVPSIRASAWSALEGDTLAVVWSLPPLVNSDLPPAEMPPSTGGG